MTSPAIEKKPVFVHACGMSLNEMVVNIRQAVKLSDRTNTNPAYQRGWYGRELDKPFHTSVAKALKVAPPEDLHQLVLEHPHVSTDGRLAYTQNDEKGFKNLQTVTTPGRYLKRHFPDLPDHEIRGLSQVNHGCRIVKTMDEMQDALMCGPHSCMKWNHTDNPYQSYCPSLGWGMAINEENGDVIGRALVHFPTMLFVRTYRKNGSKTTACETLQYWLITNGFKHADAWEEGTRLLCIDNRAPYLDGNNDRADVHDGHYIIRENGEYTLDQQWGEASGGDDSDDDDSYVGDCACCDRSIYDHEDYSCAGIYEEDRICSDCISDYTYVYGQSERQYYVPDRNAVYINGEEYDVDHLGDQLELRRLHNGEYAHEDDCFCCSVSDEYYLSEEVEVELADGDYAAECNAWKCHHSDEWYSDNEDHCMVDGEKVHPDHEDEAILAASPQLDLPLEEENELLEEHA